MAHGLCKKCYNRHSARKRIGYKATKSGWSRQYEACTECLTTLVPYESRGMCRHCYSRYRYTKEDYLKYKRQYTKRRRKEDLHFRIASNLRSRLRFALKNYSKKGKTLSYLGCSIDELKIYLESRFQKGMAWDNYGIYGWHIDHIVPLARFDLTNEEEIKKACNFQNLQPLWARENWSKQAK